MSFREWMRNVDKYSYNELFQPKWDAILFAANPSEETVAEAESKPQLITDGVWEGEDD